jgi:hypothetical protein
MCRCGVILQKALGMNEMGSKCRNLKPIAVSDFAAAAPLSLSLSLSLSPSLSLSLSLSLFLSPSYWRGDTATV